MSICDAHVGTALQRFKDRLPTLRIAVVGDVVLDQFLYGAVDRISPEAPVPVVDVDREVFRLGGAANVVHNLTTLGASVELFGVVGVDESARRLRRELEALQVEQKGVLAVSERPTAIKTRVIAQHQQVVRFDRESRLPLAAELTRTLLDRVTDRVADLHAVIVSDYGKGVVGPELMAGLVGACQAAGTLLAVDPKPVNAKFYRGISFMTPNTKETEAIAELPARSDSEVVAAGFSLLERYEAEAILVTRGERGMTLVERGAEPAHIGTRARDVFDVTGAGDTTIAVLTLALAAGCSYREAACLANVAAGIVVGKLGTAVVSTEELHGAV